MDMAAILRANAEQLEQFVAALFPYADENSFVSLRAFDQKDRKKDPIVVEGIRLGDRKNLIQRAQRAVEMAANSPEPGVFAPPVATFKTAHRGRTIDLASGVALSVEIDQGDTQIARARLEHILGPVTICVASGGEWFCPDSGEVFPKIHMHWRLSEPTATPEDHQRLRDARWFAAILVGGDTTAAPPAHPLRWPGSWNMKADQPRLARITVGNQAAEIHLTDALEKLQNAVEAAGIGKDGVGPREASDPQTTPSLLASAFANIPNLDLHWEEWNRLGMAAWRASGGSAEGLAIWADWSAKSIKHEEAGCSARWERFASSPPDRIGAGTIFHLARLNGWQRPGARIESDPPPDMDEESWHSLLSQVEGTAPSEIPDASKAKDKPIVWHSDQEWDEETLPMRDWLARGYLERGKVTVLAGAGSAGKSTLNVCYAIALALNKRWSRFVPTGRLKSMIYNVEDDDVEQKRRFSAALRQFHAKPADLNGLVTRIGPNVIGTLIERDRDTGRLRLTDVMAELEKRIEAFRPDVLFLDPMIELHTADENDNTAIRSIMAYFRTLADRYDMALVLAHHARKGSGAAAGDPDLIRGAGAIVGAARLALTVVVMTEDEAKSLNVNPAERKHYFRVDGAKMNNAPITEAEWFHRIPYNLRNGDEVAAPIPWKPANVFKEVAMADLGQALDAIERGFEPGTPFTAHKRGRASHRWAGYVLVKLCGMPEEHAGKVIFEWLRNGVLVEKPYRDKAEGKDRPGLFVGNRGEI